MLSVKNYPADYVDACEARFGRLLESWHALGVPDGVEARSFTVDFVHDMILGLEHSFVHRMRGNEGKDGNPLNEMRMLANSILEHDAVLTADKSIKYAPESSVTGLAIGAPIDISPNRLGELAAAYVSTIRTKFPPA